MMLGFTRFSPLLPVRSVLRPELRHRLDEIRCLRLQRRCRGRRLFNEIKLRNTK